MNSKAISQARCETTSFGDPNTCSRSETSLHDMKETIRARLLLPTAGFNLTYDIGDGHDVDLENGIWASFVFP